MRTVFVREIAELSPLIGALLVVAGIGGVESVSGGSDYDGMLAVVIVGGAALGLVQGGLDRWRRGDLFFKHRPVGALRFELARSLAGLLAVIAPVAVLLVAHRWATVDSIESGREFGWHLLRDVRQLTGGESWLLVVAFACTWATVRYGISRPRVWIALILCGALPVVCWAVASRFSTHVAAATFALGVTMLFAALSLIDLAGDRR